MFTGIIEEVGEVEEALELGTNREFRIRAAMTPELRVDQSVAHNGVCLTVVEVLHGAYRVITVQETLERSTFSGLRTGDPVNLERSLRVGDRLDGHMVQGHVDTVVECIDAHDRNGSWAFSFRLPDQPQLLVHKGSICLNGVSLTIAELSGTDFGVAVIPYTLDHTTFKGLRPGHLVNVEFDVLGKYVQRMLART